MAQNERLVKRNKMVASGSFTDVNFSVIYLSPILVKSGSTVDEFQHVYSIAEITPSYVQVKLAIAMLVPMAYAKNWVPLTLRFKIAAILPKNLDRNYIDRIYPFGIIC